MKTPTFIGKYFHYLTYLRFALWVLAIVNDQAFFALTSMTDLSLLLIIILPSLGLISLVFSILYRRLYIGLASLVLIRAFPITMSIG